jgi:ABC-type Fe3+-hydroxamate transport system substrate-binding protein
MGWRVVGEDDLGEPVALRHTPKRVVSLVPSITESIESVRPGVVVGATDYCTYPPDLNAVRVGGSKYPRVDDILALRPDLVVANAEENRPQDVERLRANGFPVWVTAAPGSVFAALGSLRRLLTQCFETGDPDWLLAAEEAWWQGREVHATAVVPVWRRPWVVLGRDTFAGDLLRRLGVANAYAAHPDRYPRPSVDELRTVLETGAADLVVLPDEPYEFRTDDGPEAFPGARCALVSGRHLTWYGPSLAEAYDVLAAALP